MKKTILLTLSILTLTSLIACAPSEDTIASDWDIDSVSEVSLEDAEPKNTKDNIDPKNTRSRGAYDVNIEGTFDGHTAIYRIAFGDITYNKNTHPIHEYANTDAHTNKDVEYEKNTHTVIYQKNSR